ncbi:S26 family signal peptidase [Kordiimonas marina]|uniref:S26 family signal peptidase n=1 Tax=Kordiimonas marina TaxID=2872312 RepID=UPI001FF2F73E|nr:S26 family signal peptidase [Kordiimonas marina]MCJ9427847.1 S26 family signal peptidase [Kordiimonas marina]
MLLETLFFAALVSADTPPVSRTEGCAEVDKHVLGSSLMGLIKPGQEIKVYSPACVKVGRYDYIVFQTKESDNLVIKQVWGMPGDRLAVGDDGSLTVNGVKVLTPYDRPYILMGYFRKQMKKYTGVLKGYLAMGHPGSVDSGRLGPIPPADVVGVVTRDEGRMRHLGGHKP